MPKKQRSGGKGNVIPTDMPDRWQSKCKACGTMVRAATKKDLKAAQVAHVLLVH